MKVVLVAEEAAGVHALRSIAAQDGVELVAVLTGTPSGTKRGMVVADVANKLGCTVLPAERVRDPAFGDWLRGEGIDLLVNVHSLYVIHGDVVEAPRIGSFNLHPGPLPGYAGLNAPSWAIFNGESRHAVTLHWVAPGIDTGAIAYDAWFDLDAAAAGLSCSMKCMRLGVPLVEMLVSTALRDQSAIPVVPQNGATRRYYKKADIPFGAMLDWDLPAAKLDAFIRAADYHPMPSPWGHPETRLGDTQLSVLKVGRTGRACDAAPGTLANGEGGAIEVATADEWLVLRRIEQGGRILPAEEALQAGGRLASLRPQSKPPVREAQSILG